jgi:spermidine synthase
MRSTNYSDVLTLVPPGRFGIAEIVHDTPTKTDRLHGALHGQPLTREKYCRLLLNGSPMMTDAEFERRTNMDALINAKGDALIAGLGIGLILQAFIDNCTSVTVIEKEPDVIALVAKAYPAAKIVHADIFEWRPARKAKLFDTIYFDIWADICEDDLIEARKLHRAFKPYLRPEGWMASWCRTALNHVRR